MTDPASLLRVIELGCEMRKAQRLYFRTRSPANLEASMAKERQFDQAVALVLERQSDLLS